MTIAGDDRTASGGFVPNGNAPADVPVRYDVVEAPGSGVSNEAEAQQAVRISATIQAVVLRFADALLILIKWLSGLVASHALVILGLVVAHHETDMERGWSLTAAIDHFFGSGEAAILSVTLTATALVALVWRKEPAGRSVVIFCLALAAWVFLPPMICPEVLLGKADVEQATNTSVILVMIGAGLAGAAECILGSKRTLKGGLKWLSANLRRRGTH